MVGEKIVSYLRDHGWIVQLNSGDLELGHETLQPSANLVAKLQTHRAEIVQALESEQSNSISPSPVEADASGYAAWKRSHTQQHAHLLQLGERGLCELAWRGFHSLLWLGEQAVSVGDHHQAARIRYYLQCYDSNWQQYCVAHPREVAV